VIDTFFFIHIDFIVLKFSLLQIYTGFYLALGWKDGHILQKN